jgi:hypothetical protein
MCGRGDGSARAGDRDDAFGSLPRIKWMSWIAWDDACDVSKPEPVTVAVTTAETVTVAPELAPELATELATVTR